MPERRGVGDSRDRVMQALDEERRRDPEGFARVVQLFTDDPARWRIVAWSVVVATMDLSEGGTRALLWQLALLPSWQAEASIRRQAIRALICRQTPPQTR